MYPDLNCAVEKMSSDGNKPSDTNFTLPGLTSSNELDLTGALMASTPSPTRSCPES